MQNQNTRDRCKALFLGMCLGEVVGFGDDSNPLLTPPYEGGGFEAASNKSRTNGSQRKGAALLFCLSIIAIVTLMVVNVLVTTTLELSALRNSMEYERALYLANAGVHEVAAQLEADGMWRGTITDGIYPADDTYEAIAVDGVDSAVEVTSKGVAGEVTRTVQATIEL